MPGAASCGHDVIGSALQEVEPPEDILRARDDAPSPVGAGGPRLRILHLCAAQVPDFDAGRGGAIYYRQTAEALAALGHEVHVRVINAAPHPGLAGPAGPWSSFGTLPATTRTRSAATKWAPVLSKRRRPEILVPGYLGHGDAVRRILDAGDYDLAVCDWIGSFVAFPRDRTIPILYMHHDFAHEIERVKRLHRRRKPSPRSLIGLDRLRDIELSEIRRADAVICASHAEAARIEALTGQPASYVPIYGGPIPPPSRDMARRARLFVFGFHNTAMASSMADLGALFDSLRRRHPIDIHHVGNLNGRGQAAWDPFGARHAITFHGHVSDLEAVFRPGDILVSPYAEGTGFRTKFVTAAGHGMICAGLDRSFECAPEFRGGANCIMAPDVESLSRRIAETLADPGARLALSNGARVTYDAEFHAARHLPTYRAALDRVMGRSVIAV
ncbi:MAG: glycosyltransferase [Pseudomonadota bacterium]